ncbi:ABC transporter ATP-binding protein [Phaeobacter gallaeciensis]|uniref:Branched-chain amino acid transport system ATP-binding protein n=1 Tax=Phaeobacter gallaeciensis TaxID=60890 RepID=A0AAC9Z5Z2_9RHOB|nr:ABC transporter ATP-binding protein [Phaeobacter gallaeciensis]AHD07909.1 amino acid/amide ABC transporter ATP-binding protein 1, HAAT family [Phaeobacter gallaeciensis DSM 26640]ATE91177.1 branched-chain amino acid transport system ATP-binding protein [Phaeobacter gallaeciensis]ATE95452.1 branched-chain amino acid transport system ATP-binding protein [Phaeobacter gallaeciensis]ATE99791.1 branched-chain amino acid transport system ATP-binding protein [Phaeobacter gallaeciensis]ATF04224.1 br
MTAPLLTTDELTVRFGGHVAVDAVTCAFHAGELTAIVGPNGAGKTTYFNLISGQIPATAGRVTLNGQDISTASVSARTKAGIGRAFQMTNLFPNLSVLENVRLVVQAKARRGFNLWSMVTGHADLMDQAEEILARVRLLEERNQIVSELSHGNQRKLEVALLIALDPLIYMFDEPTAGMSVDEAPVVLDLIADLKAQSDRTVLLVEHKMDVIRTLADRIIVLHNGALAADGAPAKVMASDIVQEAYMGRGLEGVLDHV